MTQSVRTALVGCGKVGHTHAQALHSLPQSQLVAVCDSDAQRAEAFAASYGAQPFTEANPDGRGERLGAYVVIPGQGCLYNLWSQLGRAHLETMIDHLSLKAGTD